MGGREEIAEVSQEKDDLGCGNESNSLPPFRLPKLNNFSQGFSLLQKILVLPHSKVSMKKGDIKLLIIQIIILNL